MKKGGIIDTLIYSNEIAIAPGVTYTRCAFFDTDLYRIESCILEVNMQCSTVHIDATLPYNGKSWGMQQTTEMAKVASREGNRVIAAVNADFFTMTSGEPEGVFVKDGIILKETMLVGKNFFGIYKNGTAVIGNEESFIECKQDLLTAVGGRSRLVRNGRLDLEEIGTDPVRHPRTAVGIKADGTVILTVVDGRQPGYSQGFDLYKLACYMQKLGAMDALNLDGGGSSTFAIRIPGTDDIRMVNRTSDGEERECADSLLIVSSAIEERKFASVHIEPFGIAVAPGGYIDFSVKGRDATGAAVPVPETGLEWALSNTQYGQINAYGHFTSNGKEGNTEILVKYHGCVVGRTELNIIQPDQLVLDTGQTLVIPENSKKHLGIVGIKNGRNIFILPHQIYWEITEGFGYVDENGMLYTGSRRMEGVVTAILKGTRISAYTFVRIGQTPVMLYDFEDADRNSGWSAKLVPDNQSIGSVKGHCSVQVAEYPFEPVRTGVKALKIIFETEGSSIHIGQDGQKLAAIPYKPSAVGMWVYMKENIQGLRFSGQLLDGDNNIVLLDFTFKQPGIHTTGWRYIEAPVPENAAAPFSFCPGDAIRLMFSSCEKTMGFIYIDDVRAVYDENQDDLIPPEVKRFDIIHKEPDTGRVDIKVWLEKRTDYPYATKINYNRIRIFVDEMEYTGFKGHYGINKGNGTVMLEGLCFKKGTHIVKLWFQDCFGNEAWGTETFIVE